MFSLLDPFKWKKGEEDELKKQLDGGNSSVQLQAMRKLFFQAMHGHPAVNSLFPCVLKLANTNNLQLKKLVFYFLSLMGHREPELAMLTVNTFTLSMRSHIPFVRNLAIRTATNMGVPGVWEHIIHQLQECLQDEDAYVRKSVVLAVAQIYKKQPELVEDVGLVSQLLDMLDKESNTSVLVNVVSALGDMERLEISSDFADKLLTVLSDSHEWGRVVILEALCKTQLASSSNTLNLCERIKQYLTHSNSAIVLTTIRVLVPLIESIPTQEDRTSILHKVGASLKSLLNYEPAIQYVALRNIRIILQKYPGIFSNDIRSFFIKYNDPIYVKMEKIDVLVRLASDRNMYQLLKELEGYAKEVDVDFVCASVRAIGRCAIKNDAMADLCVKTLLDLLESEVTYVVESVIIAFRDVFRRYPKKYEQAINRFSDRLEKFDDPEAKGSFIWMLGEYAAYIADVEVHLENVTADFAEECSIVQQTLLTAVVKLFLTTGTHQELTQTVLQKCVNVQNPDLRDRAFIYWRLLSSDPAIAKEVVLAEKPPISGDGLLISPTRMDDLLKNIGTLSSINH